MSLDKMQMAMDSLDEDRSRNLLGQAYDEVMAMLGKIERGEGMGNVLTGISAIDSAIQGVCPGMMDVYAAEAGAGKTSLTETIILKFIFEERPVLVFQRDMPPSMFFFRMACRLADVSVSQIRNFGQYHPADVRKTMDACRKLAEKSLLIVSPPGCSGEDVKKITEKESGKHGIKLVVIDHIKTLKHGKNTTWEGIEENSGFIRQSVNDTGIPHIVLAHINREGLKSDRPTISHIKGGDQLKDDSDNCCAMWLPEGKPDRSTLTPKWKVNFGFDKTRWEFGGIETMMFNGQKMRFEKIV